MDQILQFLLRHGYWVVFVCVLAEQIGLPVPSTPVLLATGALAGTGRISFPLAVALATAASVAADSIWYWLGRKRGYSILNLLCRISLEPDSCVRRTENVYSRFGAGALLIAKFVPGLSTAAPPLAGLFRMRAVRFLASDGAGSVLWVVAFSGAGYLFRTQLEDVAEYAMHLGVRLGVLMVALLGAYVLWRFWQRQRFLRKLRVARIRPEELLKKLNSGESVMVVDLRNALDVGNEGTKIPGALLMAPEELETRHEEIPRDRDIILYCT
ncbi:MAG TPA: VTT domain-containing protein [Bryobacteraceae bacterium]|nr:VTT domain-containing protein [Bryobacteraceae bacterium]